LRVGLSTESKNNESDSSPKKWRPEARHARRDAPVEAVRSTTTNPSFEHASMRIYRKTSDFSLAPCQGVPFGFTVRDHTQFWIERSLMGSSFELTRS
jgi:hypothetical protein